MSSIWLRCSEAQYRQILQLSDDDDDLDDGPQPTHRNTRLMNTELRPLALIKCPRCGAIMAPLFFRAQGGICDLCIDEANHPLIPTRIAGRAS
jgi:hypothetical protein